MGVGVVEDGGDFKILILGSQCLQIAQAPPGATRPPIANDSHSDVMKALSRMLCNRKIERTHRTH